MNDKTTAYLSGLPGTPPLEPDQPVDGINYQPLIHFLSAHWRDLLISTAVSIILSVLVAGVFGKHYMSAALLASKKPDSTSSSLPASARQLLTSGSIEPPEYQQFPDVLVSADVALRLSQNQDFLRMLFPERWDSATNQWRPPSFISQNIVVPIKVLLGYSLERTPGANAVQAFLDYSMTVTPDPKTDFIRIELSAKSPAAAKAILTAVIQTADTALRERSIADSNRKVNFLADELKYTQELEKRSAIMEVLIGAENNLALSNSNVHFSFDFIDPPTTPYKPTMNIRNLLIHFTVLATLIFFVLSCVPALFRRFGGRRGHPDP